MNFASTLAPWSQPQFLLAICLVTTMSGVIVPAMRFAKTVYYLTRSDFKTVMLPILVFSQSVVAWHSTTRFLATALWLYMVLIEFCLSNQSSGDSPVEDAHNKPYRPIPSGLMSVETARRLRYIIPFVNAVLSHYLGGRLAVLASVTLTVIDTLHNDIGLARQWWGKSLLAASCYPMGELGTIAVARAGSTVNLHQLIAVAVSAIVNITTIHAQDTPDVIGDAEAGRKTLPILYPTISRASIPLVLLASTLGVMQISDAHPAFVWLMVIFCFITSLRYILVRRPEKEMPSFVLYAVWLSLLHCSLSSLKDDILSNGLTMRTDLLQF
ncbi:hypothetical protein BT69DRAFT_1271553 [Atractiella rhizophila]|nr:hypothetical protein BT69DRAFT_1271553 [Atractiella rhizophila]